MISSPTTVFLQQQLMLEDNGVYMTVKTKRDINIEVITLLNSHLEHTTGFHLLRQHSN